MKLSTLAFSALSTISLANATDINKISVPSPTVSAASFPKGDGHVTVNGIMVNTITRKQQQQLVKIFNSSYTRITNLGKLKKISMTVENDNVGLHIKQECLLKA